MALFKICLAFLCFGFFIISVIITLLNNSSAVLLNHGIFVETSYPPISLIKKHLQETSDEVFKKALKKALKLRRLHLFFGYFSLGCGIILAALTF
ncbi:hypothetical protein [Aquimarina litoralis]|uniref:hypothetical protein n=1 Tax=Aquimarina litoralis TaxID=584605 RepID=UPI001C59DE61|nr:hypothetical protein [Aquimarina litoralis]MBW1296183.1 hypothetical protein [Aquimarina litoralis]